VFPHDTSVLIPVTMATMEHHSKAHSTRSGSPIPRARALPPYPPPPLPIGGAVRVPTASFLSRPRTASMTLDSSTVRMHQFPALTTEPSTATHTPFRGSYVFLISHTVDKKQDPEIHIPESPPMTASTTTTNRSRPGSTSSQHQKRSTLPSPPHGLYRTASMSSAHLHPPVPPRSSAYRSASATYHHHRHTKRKSRPIHPSESFLDMEPEEPFYKRFWRSLRR